MGVAELAPQLFEVMLTPNRSSTITFNHIDGFLDSRVGISIQSKEVDVYRLRVWMFTDEVFHIIQIQTWSKRVLVGVEKHIGAVILIITIPSVHGITKVEIGVSTLWRICTAVAPKYWVSHRSISQRANETRSCRFLRGGIPTSCPHQMSPLPG